MLILLRVLLLKRKQQLEFSVLKNMIFGGVEATILNARNLIANIIVQTYPKLGDLMNLWDSNKFLDENGLAIAALLGYSIIFISLMFGLFLKLLGG